VSQPAIALRSIGKRFGATTALDGASLSVARGTVHALLGENGAGKTTLMRIAYGLEQPDSGTLELGGEAIRLRSAADAIARGLGMVQQHFSLVPPMSVAENVALGGRGRYRPAAAAKVVSALSGRTSLRVDPEARVADLPPAALQKIELLKIFSREAHTLILDEPTAVLAPAEARELMIVLRHVADDGGAVVLVTHKLREALAIADEVTVLRRGRTVLHGAAKSISETDLAAAMFPEAVPTDVPPPNPAVTGATVAELSNVELRDEAGITRVHRASLAVRSGELLGLAGVEGSGHHEVLLALAGRITPTRGSVRIPSDVGFIPEHRQRDALIPAFSVTENVVLREISRARGRLRWDAAAEYARALVAQHAIRTQSVDAPVATLSGGNQQKLVLARELGTRPSLIVAENPTQGLDARATLAIRSRLRDARDGGAAVVVYASDLDDLVTMADRVIVAFAGTLREVPVNADVIGRAMLGTEA
jgi:simple sugar transport system ATP-binding protein